MKMLDLETWFRWDAFCLLAFHFRVLFSPEMMIILPLLLPLLILGELILGSPSHFWSLVYFHFFVFPFRDT